MIYSYVNINNESFSTTNEVTIEGSFNLSAVSWVLLWMCPTSLESYTLALCVCVCVEMEGYYFQIWLRCVWSSVESNLIKHNVMSNWLCCGVVRRSSNNAMGLSIKINYLIIILQTKNLVQNSLSCSALSTASPLITSLFLIPSNGCIHMLL